MRKMKKAFAATLAATMVMSMSMTAFAAKTDTDASFTKTYNATKTDTTSPQETFTFTFTPDRITDSNKQLTKDDMPAITDSTIYYAEGRANFGAAAQNVSVALSNVEWPGVGVYYYTVNETAGNTAGVTYDDTAAYLKVTVAYDEGTDTYYTAFVTLSLDDEDGDNITDTKVGGFVNEYSAGSLAVTKQVTGNLGDINQYFEVVVTFTSPADNSVVMSDIYYSGGSATGTEDHRVSGVAVEAGNGWTGEKEVTIYLNDDDTVTFTNIPEGVTYTVAEADYTAKATNPDYKLDYDAAVYENSDTKDTTPGSGTIETTLDSTTGEITDIDADTVEITNNKSTTVDTGIILDSAPYILLLALAALGMFAVVSKKREEEI